MDRRDTVINGRTYSMLQPPVRQGMPLCTQVAVLLGPVLGTLGGEAKEAGWAKFSSAIKQVDPEKVDALFMQAVKIGRLCSEGADLFVPVNFEKHFDQHRADVYPACLWVLWECVRDFFPESALFASIMKKAAEKAADEFRSQTAGRMTSGSDDQSGQDFVPGQLSQTEQWR